MKTLQSYANFQVQVGIFRDLACLSLCSLKLEIGAINITSQTGMTATGVYTWKSLKSYCSRSYVSCMSVCPFIRLSTLSSPSAEYRSQLPRPQDWRDGSAVKNTDWLLFQRKPGFISQHPHGDSKLSVTAVPGDLMPSHRHMQAKHQCKPNQTQEAEQRFL